MDNPIHERQKGVSQMIHIYSKLMSIMEGNYYELWTKWTIKKKGALKMIHNEKKWRETGGSSLAQPQILSIDLSGYPFFSWWCT